MRQGLIRDRLSRLGMYPWLPSEVSPAELAEAIECTIMQSLKPATIGFFMLYLVVAVLHLLIQPRRIGIPMTIFSLATASVFLGVRLALAKGAIPRLWAHRTVFMLACLVLCQSLTHRWLGPPGVLTAAPAIIVLAASAVFVSTRWLLLFDGVALAGWQLGQFLAFSPSPSVYFGLILGGAIVVGLLIHRLIATLILQLHALRIVDKKRSRELKEAHEGLSDALAELKRSNAELEQFAYVVSHDLKEPLRMVSSYVQLLRSRYQGELGEDADDFIGFALDGASRMEALIDGLLTYSRLGASRIEPQAVSIDAVINAAIKDLEVAISDNQATITRDAMPMVLGDTAKLARLFQNLISNAIRFRSEAPPVIHISAEPLGDEWTLSIRDNGTGIAPQHHQRIFLIFQRLHGRNEYPGTGLGLAICKQIVERHGGRIWVSSAVNRGAIFCFTLPRVEAETA